MNQIKEQIAALSSEYFEEVRSIRHHIHQHPELSCEEFKTAEYICKKLDEYGITYVKGVAQTGIVGIINGIEPESRNVALRADMDALPIREENTAEYKSLVPGKMHACGHDVHMASLLGAARILNHLRNRFNGSVKLIFQPSEETYPGGAIRMIREGVLNNPDTVSVVGQHVINTVDTGKIGLKPGPYMASTDEVFLTVKGKGGHAATPEQLIDPIVIASHIVIALQQIVSRNANPVMPTVISFGKISGEGRTNIIPDKVIIEGTVRTYDETWRKTIHEKITHIASTMAAALGGNCDVRIAHGYPFLNNDPGLTANIRQWAADYLGEKNVVDLEARMTAEDFSYFANEVPSCLYRLGIRNEARGIVSNLHTATFDVDEECLKTGMGLLAWIAVNRLNQQ
jgi:amidohydrolase